MANARLMPLPNWIRHPGGILAISTVSVFVLSGASNPSDNQASVPDFSGMWMRNGNAFDFSPPLPGITPGPLVNTSGDRLVAIGNYDSPILQPWAADMVKKHGDILKAGKIAPDAHTSCNPMGVPYVLQVRENVQFLQTKNWIMIIYQNDNQRRFVRLSTEHSVRPAPTWFGESVGHYEGNALVIDTTGIAVHETSAIDRFGTPHTEGMHVIERYTISDDRKTLRDDFTVDDPATFTSPWHASVLYGKGADRPGEHVCAENNRESTDGQTSVPTATKYDF